jgi:hypothetical protein
MDVIENLPLETLVVRICFILMICASCLSSPSTQVTNTMPQRDHQRNCTKLVTLDICATIAESIRRTHNGESISLLFGDWIGTGMNGF